MSSVLHPVGPEEPRVYWIRRAIVVGIVVLLVALLAWALAPKGNDQSAAPAAGPTDNPPASPAAPSPTDTAQATGSPSPTASASGTATPRATGSASVTGTASSTASSTAATDAVCAAKDLRVTITGPRSVKIGDHLYWDLSVINGAATPCTAKVTRDNFEVRVFSGTDKIFTTNDCKDWQKTFSEKVAPQKSHEWRLRWNVDRSTGSCKTNENLRPGTYVATAALEGADPAQFVMQVVN